MKKIYHSALQEPLKIEGILERYETNQGIAIANDITSNIPKEFYKADCIYSEPSWRAGYDKFAERAGIIDSNFNEYLYHIRMLIAKLEVPTYIVLGKHMLKRLKPEETKVIKLHGYECLLGLWNVNVKREFKDNYEVMDYVTKEHNYILDFSCGYGNTVEKAIENNKKFIAADLNQQCIYYIAKKYMGYEG